MLSKLLIGFFLMALCVAIHATGLTSAFRWMHARLARGTGQVWHATWMLVRIAAWTATAACDRDFRLGALLRVARRDAGPRNIRLFQRDHLHHYRLRRPRAASRMAPLGWRRSAHRHPDVRTFHRLILRRIYRHLRPQPRILRQRFMNLHRSLRRSQRSSARSTELPPSVILVTDASARNPKAYHGSSLWNSSGGNDGCPRRA